MMMRRSFLLAAPAVRQLSAAYQRSTLTIAAPMRFQQMEWRRAWTREEQASQVKHEILQRALQKAQAKDAALMAKACEDLLSSVGSKWKLDLTTTSYEHVLGDPSSSTTTNQGH
jgi:hypothetical protein